MPSTSSWGDLGASRYCERNSSSRVGGWQVRASMPCVAEAPEHVADGAGVDRQHEPVAVLPGVVDARASRAASVTATGRARVAVTLVRVR